MSVVKQALDFEKRHVGEDVDACEDDAEDQNDDDFDYAQFLWSLNSQSHCQHTGTPLLTIYWNVSCPGYSSKSLRQHGKLAINLRVDLR